MDENTKKREDQASPQVTTPVCSVSGSLNDLRNAVPQQTVSSIDGIAQQHCASPPTTVMPLTHSGGSSMSFLDLPPEIRNMIYCCVFPKGQSAVQLLARHSGKGYIAMSDRLQLLYTCRQIYEEATGLLQSSRRFKVVQPRSLWDLINKCRYPTGNCCCRCDDLENGILDQILPQEGIFVDYDLDRGTVRGNIPSLLHTNWSFRCLCVRSASLIRFTAQTNISTTEPVSDSFGALQNWLRQLPSYLLSLIGDPTRTEMSVILNFTMNTITQFEDIRFEMNSLSDAIVRQPPVMENGQIADLMVRIENPGRSVSSAKKQIVDVLMESLMFMQKVRTEHPKLRYERCPKILIDGRFRVREAQFCLKDGSMLEITNEESFWEFGESDGWEDDDFEVKWDDMISAGLMDDFDPRKSWPSPKFETINNETLGEGTVELAKRVIDCFWA